eukprot:TRINITY_DN11156_c0_g1_i1.p1 TRINITY_DN11156_c0_g1~~TRINITY_DN11156_c0_g1_i1.p1  ORF type:complete len:239 (+),score=36.56 TRINITY_DN11156_c0_g1_i1:643-1359(+)
MSETTSLSEGDTSASSMDWANSVDGVDEDGISFQTECVFDGEEDCEYALHDIPPDDDSDDDNVQLGLFDPDLVETKPKTKKQKDSTKKKTKELDLADSLTNYRLVLKVKSAQLKPNAIMSNKPVHSYLYFAFGLQVGRTKPIKGTNNPKFDTEFECEIVSKYMRIIKFQIFQKHRIMTDEVLGTYELDVIDIMKWQIARKLPFEKDISFTLSLSPRQKKQTLSCTARFAKILIPESKT